MKESIFIILFIGMMAFLGVYNGLSDKPDIEKLSKSEVCAYTEDDLRAEFEAKEITEEMIENLTAREFYEIMLEN